MELSASSAAADPEEEAVAKANPSETVIESREEMLSRHRKEIAEIQNKEISLKKAAAKGSKAEQKAKKKQVEEEILQLLSGLKVKHAEEIASLGYKTSINGQQGNLDSLVMAIAGVSTSDNSRKSRSAKRRGKRAQQEAERDQRIQEEQSNVVSDRAIEDERLERKLKPLGLTIKEIKPDGHCLYRAVEDQLAFHLGGAPSCTCQKLREMSAKYMREHESEFLPFFLSDAEGEMGDPSERFEKYCTEMESTAAWGGHLELQALAHCLRKHVIVYSASFPNVEMGKEYRTNGNGHSSNPSILLSYHTHAYGLGEHYNSVIPAEIIIE